MIDIMASPEFSLRLQRLLRPLERLQPRVARFGLMFGLPVYFQKPAPEKMSTAIDRFQTTAKPNIREFDGRLVEAEWSVGHAYSITNFASIGWVREPQHLARSELRLYG
jgi:hypothetical protein